MTIDRPSLAPTTPALRRIAIEEVTLFYREPELPSDRSRCCIHGFPSSSHMSRNLIPLLAEALPWRCARPARIRFTTAPARGQFDYSFDISPRSCAPSPTRSGSTAMRSTYSTMARRWGSGWRMAQRRGLGAGPQV